MNYQDSDGHMLCKLISPARILEWMLVDGLYKNLYWVPNEIKNDQDYNLNYLI